MPLQAKAPEEVVFHPKGVLALSAMGLGVYQSLGFRV